MARAWPGSGLTLEKRPPKPPCYWQDGEARMYPILLGQTHISRSPYNA